MLHKNFILLNKLGAVLLLEFPEVREGRRKPPGCALEVLHSFRRLLDVGIVPLFQSRRLAQSTFDLLPDILQLSDLGPELNLNQLILANLLQQLLSMLREVLEQHLYLFSGDGHGWLMGIYD